MTHPPPDRRAVLGGGMVSALALAGTSLSAGTTGAQATEETFTYEIRRSDAEWRAMLSRDEYVILRKGSTELPRSHPYWNHFEDGTYACRGCALTVFDSVWKVPVDKGWAFFAQSRENAVLMGIDGPLPGADDGPNAPRAMIEAHCRRCGSHLGHIVTVDGRTLHCINGTSLVFEPATA